MTLGEQIKQAREAKNLSQEELAAQLEVSHQAVSKWENGSSSPRGINRELLSQILGLELCEENPAPVVNSKQGKMSMFGWVAAAILAILLLVVIAGTRNADMPENAGVPKEPVIKSIAFYDCDQNEVLPEALWYNSAQIESILIQWEGGTPDNIKMFATPGGTETMEETELLLTKNVLDGDCVGLLDADALKGKYQVHIFFQLEFGEENITSDLYNVFYDETWNMEES